MSDRLECDIVLRGGVASGIVYPLAIAELAQTYDFRSIGGTSAGAIAGAWTAATALGKKRGKDNFKTSIRNHPQELAVKGDDGRTLYERLFQPQPSTRRLFYIFMAFLNGGNRWIKYMRIGLRIVASYPLFAFAGAALSVLPFLALVAGRGAAPDHQHLALVASIPTIVSATVLALLAAFLGGLVWDFCACLNPRNGYGLCSGSNNGTKDESGVLPLTDWLHRFVQSLAGDLPLNKPVTFGNLWNNGDDEKAPRDIDLVMITTNITRGISQRLPFLEGCWGPLFFRTQDLHQLFPPGVVDWMKCHAQEAREGGYYRLPKPADLPIVFAARMSASLPFLLSAVPLYSPYVTRTGKSCFKRCWFSDGGLASNFPVHLFDAPLPLRPTFAINFVSNSVEIMEVNEIKGRTTMISCLGTNGARDEAKCWDKVWMPTKNADGIMSAARFDSFSDVGGFFSALLNTALGWADTELMAMPGYRDRIVHVKLAKGEGGINLNMSDTTIIRVSKLGECAGKLLAARFAPQPGKDPRTGENIELTWDNHRWVRYRSVMAALEVFAQGVRAKWAHPNSPWCSYRQLIKSYTPKGYPFGAGQTALAVRATDRVVRLVNAWKTENETFDRPTAPRPKAVLRVTPPGSDDPLN
jgi:predicted acylesterase/phospholipase RssA